MTTKPIWAKQKPLIGPKAFCFLPDLRRTYVYLQGHLEESRASFNLGTSTLVYYFHLPNRFRDGASYDACHNSYHVILHEFTIEILFKVGPFLGNTSFFTTSGDFPQRSPHVTCLAARGRQFVLSFHYTRGPYGMPILYLSSPWHSS